MELKILTYLSRSSFKLLACVFRLDGIYVAVSAKEGKVKFLCGAKWIGLAAIEAR